MTFPPNMRAYLLKVDEKTWRQIRAQVRWSYIKQSYEPPRRLVRFIPVALPANPYDWKEYADEITRIRRERVRNSALERQKRKQDRRIRQRRDYQRNYMREYRDRLRRGTV